MFESLVVLSHHRRRTFAEIETAMRADSNRALLSELHRRGAVRHPRIFSVGDERRTIPMDGVAVEVITSPAALPADALAAELLLVRSDKWAWVRALRKGSWKVWMFYGASRRFYPRRTWGYDIIFCDEPRHVEHARRLFPTTHCARWLKTTDVGIYRPLPGEPRKFDVVCFGNMDSPAKNYGALPAIVNARPHLRWLIIGRTEPALMRQLATSGASITYAGHIAPAEANRLLNRSGVGLILSEQDGSPRTLLESMASGLPQIVNENLVSGTSYVVPGAGFVAPVARFPELIDQVLAARSTLDAAGAFGRNFSPGAAADALLAAVDAVLPHAGRQRTALRRWWSLSRLGSKLNSGRWRARRIEL